LTAHYVAFSACSGFRQAVLMSCQPLHALQPKHKRLCHSETAWRCSECVPAPLHTGHRNEPHGCAGNSPGGGSDSYSGKKQCRFACAPLTNGNRTLSSI